MNETVDLNKIPYHMREDFSIRNKNIKLDLKICSRCDGTGNEFFSMYRKCQACLGDGISKNNENLFKD